MFITLSRNDGKYGLFNEGTKSLAVDFMDWEDFQKHVKENYDSEQQTSILNLDNVKNIVSLNYQEFGLPGYNFVSDNSDPPKEQSVAAKITDVIKDDLKKVTDILKS